MTLFDKEFKKLYRESTFLNHPLVPSVVIDNTSRLYIIVNQYVLDHDKDLMNDVSVTKVEPADYNNGMTDDEIVHYFKSNPATILNFASLYDAYDRFTDSRQNSAFQQKLDAALKPSCYRQDTLCKTWPRWLTLT